MLGRRDWKRTQVRERDKGQRGRVVRKKGAEGCRMMDRVVLRAPGQGKTRQVDTSIVLPLATRS